MVCCCFVVVAQEKSGLCHSKLESSHSARLTWRINTDVSNAYALVGGGVALCSKLLQAT